MGDDFPLLPDKSQEDNKGVVSSGSQWMRHEHPCAGVAFTGQFQVDKWVLEEVFCCKRAGVYVDIGAAHSWRLQQGLGFRGLRLGWWVHGDSTEAAIGAWKSANTAVPDSF